MNLQVKPSRLTVVPGDAFPTLVSRARSLADALFLAAEQADASAAIAPETWRSIRQSGLLMAPFPAEEGGEDLLAPERHHDLATVLRLIGSADLSIARLYEGHINGVALVCRYGTAGQVTSLATAIKGGGLAGVWGADDAAGLHARRDAAGWRLQGRKILASGGGFVSRPVITAMSDLGQIMVLPRLIDGGETDISGWTAQGMRSSATGTIELSDVSLAADQILGQPGDFMQQPHFSGGAWRFCAVHLGATERLVDLFRHHLIARGRGDDPYQLQRVAHCAAATTTAGFWVSEAARRLAEDVSDPDDLVAYVNLTRMVTERAALDVLEAVHRGVGLSGFLRPSPIERISRDLATYLRQPVPDLAMADAARAILASDRPTGSLWSSAFDR